MENLYRLKLSDININLSKIYSKIEELALDTVEKEFKLVCDSLKRLKILKLPSNFEIAGLPLLESLTIRNIKDKLTLQNVPKLKEISAISWKICLKNGISENKVILKKDNFGNQIKIDGLSRNDFFCSFARINDLELPLLLTKDNILPL